MFDDLIPEKKSDEDTVDDKFGKELLNNIPEYEKNNSISISCPRCGNDVYKRFWEIDSFQCKHCGHMFLTKWESK